MFDLKALQSLYDNIRAEDGFDLADLTARLDDLFDQGLGKTDLARFREGDKPWKPLREEVSPIVRVLTLRGHQGRIRFPLSDAPRDAEFMLAGSDHWVPIEATGALSRSRYDVGKQLRAGLAPGFRAIPNERPQAEFDAARERSRVTFTPTEIAKGFVEGVAAAMARKNNLKYAGHALVIVAAVESLPAHLRDGILEASADLAAVLPFDQVFLIGEGEKAKPIELHRKPDLPSPL